MAAINSRHLERVAALGCIVCHREGHYNAPAEIHHIRSGQGIGQRADDFLAIPLCPEHHRIGGHGVAIHAGRLTWEANHGSELELLAATYRLLMEAMEAAISGVATT